MLSALDWGVRDWDGAPGRLCLSQHQEGSEDTAVTRDKGSRNFRGADLPHQAKSRIGDNSGVKTEDGSAAGAGCREQSPGVRVWRMRRLHPAQMVRPFLPATSRLTKPTTRQGLLVLTPLEADAGSTIQAQVI